MRSTLGSVKTTLPVSTKKEGEFQLLTNPSSSSLVKSFLDNFGKIQSQRISSLLEIFNINIALFVTWPRRPMACLIFCRFPHILDTGISGSAAFVWPDLKEICVRQTLTTVWNTSVLTMVSVSTK